jgi:hypothetical protein
MAKQLDNVIPVGLHFVIFPIPIAAEVTYAVYIFNNVCPIVSNFISPIGGENSHGFLSGIIFIFDTFVLDIFRKKLMQRRVLWYSI